MDQAGSQEIAGSRTRVPGYILDRGISVDRSGAIVVARDIATGSRVTIRLLSPALSSDAAFRRQVRHDMGVLGALRHQHLLAVIAFDDHAAAVICEWVDGVTLGHMVDVSRQLPPAAALVVFDDCLSGLEALHAAGIVHRDVRPDAVILDTGGTAILRDAGIPAAALHHGWRAGTPQYMAPELWAGRTHTVATDLYAATGVLVDALTGHPPYLGTDLSGLGVQHTQGALPIESVPMMARALVISGLAKDPRDRPGSAALFRRDVDIAGATFLGPGWRDRGRAWLAEAVADRIADPVPSLLPVAELADDDDDDGEPLAGIAIETGSDERRPGGVGWKVWAVAAAAVLVLAVVTFATVNALGGSPVVVSPSAPAAPLFTPTAAPSEIVLPTSTDTAAPATPTASPRPSPTTVPTIAPNTAPVSLAATPTPQPTPTPITTPSPSP